MNGFQDKMPDRQFLTRKLGLNLALWGYQFYVMCTSGVNFEMPLIGLPLPIATLNRLGMDYLKSRTWHLLQFDDTSAKQYFGKLDFLSCLVQCYNVQDNCCVLM